MAATTSVAAAAAATSLANALTTTFTPPAPCATQFMQLAILQNSIWMNPITPASGLVDTSCYALQWLASSSIAALDPLVCPSNYQTQTTFDSPAGYIVCCPQGFSGVSLDPDAPANRPAVNATCYTNIANSAILVTEFGISSATATTEITLTNPTAQAYAHAYDGYMYVPAAATSSSTPSSPSAPSKTTSPTSSATSTSSSTSNALSGGAIAGAVIGAVLGIGLIVGLLAVWLVRRRRRRAEYEPPPVEMAGDSFADAAAPGRGEKGKTRNAKLGVLPDLPGELATEENPAEMAGGSHPSEMMGSTPAVHKTGGSSPGYA